MAGHRTILKKGRFSWKCAFEEKVLRGVEDSSPLRKGTEPSYPLQGGLPFSKDENWLKEKKEKPFHLLGRSSLLPWED